MTERGKVTSIAGLPVEHNARLERAITSPGNLFELLNTIFFSMDDERRNRYMNATQRTDLLDEDLALTLVSQFLGGKSLIVSVPSLPWSVEGVYSDRFPQEAQEVLLRICSITGVNFPQLLLEKLKPTFDASAIREINPRNHKESIFWQYTESTEAAIRKAICVFYPEAMANTYLAIAGHAVDKHFSNKQIQIIQAGEVVESRYGISPADLIDAVATHLGINEPDFDLEKSRALSSFQNLLPKLNKRGRRNAEMWMLTLEETEGPTDTKEDDAIDARHLAQQERWRQLVAQRAYTRNRYNGLRGLEARKAR